MRQIAQQFIVFAIGKRYFCTYDGNKQRQRIREAGEMQIIYTILQALISGKIKMKFAEMQGRALGSRKYLEFPARRRRGKQSNTFEV